MTFRVGERVVCVDDKFSLFSRSLGVSLPSKDKVYEIRDIVLGHDGTGERPGVVLAEIVNSIGPRGVEYNFNPDRFRPIVSRKTSIEIFTRMLTPQGVDA